MLICLSPVPLLHHHNNRLPLHRHHVGRLRKRRKQKHRSCKGNHFRHVLHALWICWCLEHFRPCRKFFAFTQLSQWLYLTWQNKQYSAEISPTCVRPTIVACGYATFNAVVILLVYITPLALQAISWKYFLIFVICDFIFIVMFYFFYPETKNKTLEEIEAVFGDKVSFLTVLSGF